jgi:hypothetical protein
MTDQDDPGDPTQDRYDLSHSLDPSVIDNDALHLQDPYADPGEFLARTANDTLYGSGPASPDAPSEEPEDESTE